MNLYFLGILAALVVFFAVGIAAGRMVKDTNDYYVSGRNAPTLLIVGSLIASFLSTGAFLGDTGEVYSGFFIGIPTGEVGCLGDDFDEALLNALIATGYKIPTLTC